MILPRGPLSQGAEGGRSPSLNGAPGSGKGWQEALPRGQRCRALSSRVWTGTQQRRGFPRAPGFGVPLLKKGGGAWVPMPNPVQAPSAAPLTPAPPSSCRQEAGRGHDGPQTRAWGHTQTSCCSGQPGFPTLSAWGQRQADAALYGPGQRSARGELHATGCTWCTPPGRT